MSLDQLCPEREFRISAQIGERRRAGRSALALRRTLDAAMNLPQMVDRVSGKDGRPYMISTIRYEKSELGELWETAVFEGHGLDTTEGRQRYSMWMFFESAAHVAHADLVSKVQNEMPEQWVMPSELIEKVRQDAVEVLHPPPA
jgi:hypothetical protein